MHRKNVSFPLFADILRHFYPLTFHSLATAPALRWKTLIKDITSWMTSNFNKLNSEKTDLRIGAIRSTLQQLQQQSLLMHLCLYIY